MAYLDSYSYASFSASISIVIDRGGVPVRVVARTAPRYRSTCEPVAHTLTARAGRGTRSRRRFRRPPAHAHRAGAPRPVRTLPATRVSPRARHAHGSPMGRQDTPQPHRTRSVYLHRLSVHLRLSPSEPLATPSRSIASLFPSHADRHLGVFPCSLLAYRGYSLQMLRLMLLLGVRYPLIVCL